MNQGKTFERLEVEQNAGATAKLVHGVEIGGRASEDLAVTIALTKERMLELTSASETRGDEFLSLLIRALRNAVNQQRARVVTALQALGREDLSEGEQARIIEALKKQGIWIMAERDLELQRLESRMIAEMKPHQIIEGDSEIVRQKKQVELDRLSRRWREEHNRISDRYAQILRELQTSAA